MKYSILVNQFGADRAGLRGKLDIIDLAVFDAFRDFANSNRCEKLIEGKRVYFWIGYDMIIQEIPYSGLKKPDSVYRRMKNLADAGVIEFYSGNARLRKSFFTWGEKYDLLISDDPRIKIRAIPGSKSGLSPDQNPPDPNTNTPTTNDPYIPGGKKPPASESKKEAWTKNVARLFDQVNERGHIDNNIEYQPFNWAAGGGRQFAALGKLKKAMKTDIRAKNERDNRENPEPTEQEYLAGFDYLFRYGFKYLAKIADEKGGRIQFTPAIILNLYNQILQYARQEHRNKNGRDSQRIAAIQELAAAAAEMDID